MERRWYVTALRGDDVRCRRKWTLAVAAFYAMVLGVLGSAAWLGTKPAGADLGLTAMAGRVVPTYAALSGPLPWREMK
jgi:hypothetical protein